MPNLSLAARNITVVVWNRSAKLYRRGRHWTMRVAKEWRESRKALRGCVRAGAARGRDTAHLAYTGTVRSSRYWRRTGRRVWPAVVRDMSVRRELRAAAGGSRPVLVGPWLSEVGYEVLYWVPFVRWFADHYRVPPERLIAVSRGGVATWYDGVAARYVEQLELFSPDEFARRNEERQASTDQKQMGIAAFDEELIARARARLGVSEVAVCHPSLMFRLLRHFWLGTESLQYVLDYTRYSPVSRRAAVPLPPLPSTYVAVKFYTGRALPDTERHRDLIRSLVERLARHTPVVFLTTGLALDEHEDYVFRSIPNAILLDRSLTPQNNLAIQTEVIRGASRFVGTCGSLAWLAPMLGTPTVAVYADDHFLTPHLYAARHAYASMGAAPFTSLDLNVLDLGLFEQMEQWAQR